MSAYRNCRKGIIYTKFARHIDFHIKITNSRSMISYPQITRPVNQPDILCTQIRLLGKSIRLDLTRMSGNHILYMRIVCIHNASFTLTKQHSFTCQIFFKRSVFVWPDMIWLNIRKNTDIK